MPLYGNINNPKADKHSMEHVIVYADKMEQDLEKLNKMCYIHSIS